MFTDSTSAAQSLRPQLKTSNSYVTQTLWGWNHLKAFLLTGLVPGLG